jgi:hypothetical protein
MSSSGNSWLRSNTQIECATQLAMNPNPPLTRSKSCVTNGKPQLTSRTWAWDGISKHVAWRSPRRVASLSCYRVVLHNVNPRCLCPPALPLCFHS